MKTNKNFDYWLLFIWNVPAFFLATHYGINYLISAFIIAGIPAMYLTCKKPALLRKISIVSIFMAVIGVTIVSYLGHRDQSWYDPSFFPRILGIYPVEDFVWGFIYFYYMLAFYEYFYEKEKILHFPKHFKKYVNRALIFIFIFSVTASLVPSIFIIPYFYACFLVVCTFLIVYIFSPHPGLIVKAIKVDIFFLIPHVIGEFVAMTNHNWSFPGRNFIGYVSAAGITIPLEEFLWMLLLVPAAIAYYELIADDLV